MSLTMFVKFLMKKTFRSGWEYVITTIFLLSIFAVYCKSPDRTGNLLSAGELIAFRDSVNQVFENKFGQEKLWGEAVLRPGKWKKGDLIFSENFEDLRNWHHEGRGNLSQPDSGIMQINCIGSAQGGVGCMAFCNKTFPDNLCIEYDLKVLTTNGLIITFIACNGRRGEDMLTQLPARKGSFADYVYNPDLRSYHISLSRYDDNGNHTGVSNWRRNPGLFLMGQQVDLCQKPQTWYHIKIVKADNLLQLWVNNLFAGGFRDKNEIPEPIPQQGKIGFRAIGSNVIAQIKNFKVSLIK